MTVSEAIQIIGLIGYVAEHDGTIDPGVIQDAVSMAVAALKEVNNE